MQIWECIKSNTLIIYKKSEIQIEFRFFYAVKSLDELHSSKVNCSLTKNK